MCMCLLDRIDLSAVYGDARSERGDAADRHAPPATVDHRGPSVLLHLTGRTGVKGSGHGPSPFLVRPPGPVMFPVTLNAPPVLLPSMLVDVKEHIVGKDHVALHAAFVAALPLAVKTTGPAPGASSVNV